RHCRDNAFSSGSVSPPAASTARSTSSSAHSSGNSDAKSARSILCSLASAINASNGPIPPRQGASAENQDSAVCVFCDQPVSKKTYVADHFGEKCVGGRGEAGREEAERVTRSIREDARA